MSKQRLPRPMSLVEFNFKQVPDSYGKIYPFVKDRVYIFLGEIVNMQGHGVFMDHVNGNIYSGYHIENFVELSEEKG